MADNVILALADRLGKYASATTDPEITSNLLTAAILLRQIRLSHVVAPFATDQDWEIIALQQENRRLNGAIERYDNERTTSSRRHLVEVVNLNAEISRLLGVITSLTILAQRDSCKGMAINLAPSDGTARGVWVARKSRQVIAHSKRQEGQTLAQIAVYLNVSASRAANIANQGKRFIESAVARGATLPLDILALAPASTQDVVVRAG